MGTGFGTFCACGTTPTTASRHGMGTGVIDLANRTLAIVIQAQKLECLGHRLPRQTRPFFIAERFQRCERWGVRVPVRRSVKPRETDSRLDVSLGGDRDPNSRREDSRSPRSERSRLRWAGRPRPSPTARRLTRTDLKLFLLDQPGRPLGGRSSTRSLATCPTRPERTIAILAGSASESRVARPIRIRLMMANDDAR